MKSHFTFTLHKLYASLCSVFAFCCVCRGLLLGRYLVQGVLKIIPKIGKGEILDYIGPYPRKITRIREIKEKRKQKGKAEKVEEERY